jgi:molecular chaperone GrpE (heat shock protein)
MKGIYLTQEGKQELEAKIAELENQLQLVGNLFENIEHNHNYLSTKLRVYKEILSSATILPVEESWDNAIDTHDVENAFVKHYPNGVIIKSKK